METVKQKEDEGMSATHKVQWPKVFTGLRGIPWAYFPSEISAGITLAALIIPLNLGYAPVAELKI
jgi:MFS superfamily sulfate permease-like transporter